MTKFTRLLLIIPVLSVFTASSLSGALATDKKSTSGGQSKGATNTGGKSSGGSSKSGGQSGSPRRRGEQRCRRRSQQRCRRPVGSVRAEVKCASPVLGCIPSGVQAQFPEH